MTYLDHEHRRFEGDRFLWEKTEVTPKVEAEKKLKTADEAKSEFLKDIDKVERRPTEESLGNLERGFDEKFGPAAFEKEIRDYLGENRIAERHLEKLVAESVERYKSEYQALKADFLISARNRVVDLKGRAGTIDMAKEVKTRAKGIENAVGREMELGEGQVERHRKTQEIETEIGIELAENRIDKAVDRIADDWVEALGDDYLDPDLLKDRVSNTERKHFIEGKKREIRSAIQKIQNKKLDMDETRKAVQAAMEEFKAGWDSNAGGDGMVDAMDMARLKREAGLAIDLFDALKTSGSDAELIRNLEAKRLIDPENWLETVDLFADSVMATVEKGGVGEETFAKHIQTLKGESDEIGYGKAERLFREELSDRAKRDVPATLEWCKAVLGKLFEGEPDFSKMEGVPEPLRDRVLAERRLLMAQTTWPKDQVDDRAVIGFLRQSESAKKEALRNPRDREALLDAVQHIKDNEESEQWQKRINLYDDESKVGKPGSPERPNTMDRTARFLAMVSLAKEADWVIGNLTKQKGMEDVAEKVRTNVVGDTAPGVDTLLGDARRKVPLRYRSTWSESGLTISNGVSKFAQIWGIFAMIVNAKSSGWDFLSNPYFLTGAAVAGGATVYRNAPEVLAYPKQDEGGKDRIRTQVSLRIMAERVGRENLIRFINDPNEWRAMESVSPKVAEDRVSKSKDALKIASDRKGKPFLLKKDLEGVAEPGALSQLSESKDGWRERTRYFFYQSFMTQKKPPLNQLKAFAEGWTQNK